MFAVVRTCLSAYSAITSCWTPNDRTWPSTLRSVTVTYLLSGPKS